MLTLLVLKTLPDRLKFSSSSSSVSKCDLSVFLELKLFFFKFSFGFFSLFFSSSSLYSS